MEGVRGLRAHKEVGRTRREGVQGGRVYKEGGRTRREGAQSGRTDVTGFENDRVQYSVGDL